MKESIWMVFDFGGRPQPLRPERRERSGGGDVLGGTGDRPWWLWPAAVLGALILLGILLLATAGFWANLWWFSSLGFQGVLVTRYIATIVSFLIGFAVAALFIGINLIVALRSDGGVDLTIGDVRLGRRLSLFAILAVTVGLSALFAIAVGAQWELFLRFLNRTQFGIADPQFHQDVSFYVFTLPVLAFWRSWAMSLIVLTAIAVAAVYAAKLGADLVGGRFHLPPHTRAHLSLLGVFFLIGSALGYWLDTRELVYSTRGVVEGASYTDVNAQIPANYILLAISLVAAILLVVNAFRRQLPLFIGTLGVWAVAAVLIGSGYPAVVQSASVRPNELSKERPYIDRNIAMTRQAFNITQVDRQQLAGVGDPTQAGLDANKASIANIRLWDASVLAKSYAQLQQIRQYYAFKDVDIDRYQVNGQYRQIMLSARELDSTQLAAQSQTWQNRHLIYTHGYGAVASTANEVVGGGNPNIILGDIPPRGPSDLQVQEPRIYYGEATNDYVFVKTKQPEFDRPSGTAAESQGVYTTYAGGNGVPAGSFARKVILAAYLGEPKVLLSSDITGNAEVLFRRNIVDRLHTVAPFLRYDNDPYLVIIDGRLVWVNDAYTLTNRYPYSTQFNGVGTTDGFNYIRNSVKATVDAYDGTVRLYVVDPSDPLIATYQKIYPSLFAPGSAVSPSLRAHFRYPEDYFNVQTAMYTRYHVTDAQVFYGSEDQWAIANVQVGEKKVVQPIASYYVLVRLPGQQQEEFVLVRPFTPGGGTNNRQNMVAFLAGRSDGANYGKLMDYEFPRELTVQGPQQVEARINQEPDISKEITLLDQAGSQVILGNFLIIPIENTLLYVEPLYVQAVNSPFPELKRVIVASQNSVVMRPSLDEAIAALVTGAAPSTTAPVTNGTPAGQASSPAAGGTDAARAADALSHYQRAQDALKSGDWATYGNELAQVQQILQQLAGSATPTPAQPTGAPAGTQRPAPSATPHP